MARPTLLPLAALLGLLLTAPALPAAEAEPEAPAAATETPAAAEIPPPFAPENEAAAPVVEAAPETAEATASAPVAIEGTKLLFLRLGLRIKRIELELLDAPQEAMVEHLNGAADLLQQLRARYLTDDEALRTDRAEQYLQELMLRYSERQAALAEPAKKKGRRKR